MDGPVRLIIVCCRSNAASSARAANWRKWVMLRVQGLARSKLSGMAECLGQVKSRVWVSTLLAWRHWWKKTTLTTTTITVITFHLFFLKKIWAHSCIHNLPVEDAHLVVKKAASQTIGLSIKEQMERRCYNLALTCKSIKKIVDPLLYHTVFILEKRHLMLFEFFLLEGGIAEVWLANIRKRSGYSILLLVKNLTV